MSAFIRPGTRAAAMLNMCRRDIADGNGGVHIALPEDKRTAVRLERAGLITIRRTNVRCDGHIEWWGHLAKGVE